MGWNDTFSVMEIESEIKECCEEIARLRGEADLHGTKQSLCNMICVSVPEDIASKLYATLEQLNGALEKNRPANTEERFKEMWIRFFYGRLLGAKTAMRRERGLGGESLYLQVNYKDLGNPFNEHATIKSLSLLEQTCRDWIKEAQGDHSLELAVPPLEEAVRQEIEREKNFFKSQNKNNLISWQLAKMTSYKSAEQELREELGSQSQSLDQLVAYTEKIRKQLRSIDPDSDPDYEVHDKARRHGRDVLRDTLSEVVLKFPVSTLEDKLWLATIRASYGADADLVQNNAQCDDLEEQLWQKIKPGVYLPSSKEEWDDMYATVKRCEEEWDNNPSQETYISLACIKLLEDKVSNPCDEERDTLPTRTYVRGKTPIIDFSKINRNNKDTSEGGGSTTIFKELTRCYYVPQSFRSFRMISP